MEDSSSRNRLAGLAGDMGRSIGEAGAACHPILANFTPAPEIWRDGDTHPYTGGRNQEGDGHGP